MEEWKLTPEYAEFEAEKAAGRKANPSKRSPTKRTGSPTKRAGSPTKARQEADARKAAEEKVKEDEMKAREKQVRQAYVVQTFEEPEYLKNFDWEAIPKYAHHTSRVGPPPKKVWLFALCNSSFIFRADFAKMIKQFPTFRSTEIGALHRLWP